jgi:hypothetical protein
LESSSPEAPSARSSKIDTSDENRDSLSPILTNASGADVEAGGTPTPAHTPSQHPSPGLRRRRPDKAATGTGRPTVVTPTLRAVGSILRMAHAQDYAKKKPAQGDERVEGASSDEDDEEADRFESTAELQSDRRIEEAEAAEEMSGKGKHRFPESHGEDSGT